MNFQYEGQVFDTSTLRTFATDDRWIPFVWMTPDDKAVFYATVDDANAMEIRRASNADIRRLAGRYKLDLLRKAQRHTRRRAVSENLREMINPSGGDASCRRMAEAFHETSCPPSFSFP